MIVKNEKAITLIVLVITIILLLILSGVAITTLMGENGILNKAQNAKDEYELAREKEQKVLDSYGSILIADNDSSQLTISVKELKQLIKDEIENVSKVPVGTLISYMGNNTPEGYIVCDGKTYNISEYSSLAEQIKTEFGSYSYFGGDGVTTFAVPNLNEKFLKGSNIAGKSENAGLPNITAGANLYTWRDGITSGALSSGIINSNVLTVGNTVDYNYVGFTLDASRSSSIYGKSETVTPENISVLYCIKY